MSTSDQTSTTSLDPMTGASSSVNPLPLYSADNLFLRHRELLNQGEDVIDLSMVNPDIAPPRYAMDRLVEAITKPQNHRYAVSRGVRKIREGFSAKYLNAFGVSLDPDTEVCLTLGTKDAVFQALGVVCQPGDKVILVAPTYPAYLHAVEAHRLTPVIVSSFRSGAPLSEQELLEKLEAAALAVDAGAGQRPKIMILNYPSNPTGLTVSGDFWFKIRELSAKSGCIILNDFVYGEMPLLGEKPKSLLGGTERLADRARILETYSLSKAYGVPGWRIGCVAGDRDLVGAIAKLKSRLDYGAFLPLQFAAAAVLSHDQDLVGGTCAEYARRVDVVCRGLDSLGWRYIKPIAGASVFFELPQALVDRRLTGKLAKQDVAEESVSIHSGESGMLGHVKESSLPASFILERSRVSLMPGGLFGEGFSSWLRLALVAAPDRLRDVMNRLSQLCILIVLSLSFCGSTEQLAFAAEQDCIQASRLVREGTQFGDGSDQEESRYRQAISMCSGMAEAYHNLGIVLAKRQKLEEAIAQVEKAMAIKNDPRFALSLAGLLLKKGELERASQLYDQILVDDPKSVRGLQGKAVIYERQGRYEDSAQTLLKALALDGSDAVARFNLGVSYDHLGRKDEAIAAYREVIRSKGDHFEAHYHLGTALWEQRKFEEARDALARAAEVRPDDASTRRMLGFVFEALNDLDQSEASFRKALEINQSDVGSRVSLGAVLMAKKRPEQAVVEEEKALEVDGRNAKALTILGIAQLQLGHTDQAEKALKRAVEIDSANAAAQYNLGVALERMGDEAGSSAAFARAQQLDPNIVK